MTQDTRFAERTISRILALAAATTLVIGLITLLAPAQVIRIFDGYDAGNFHFVRFIGTALIGFSVMNWLYSRFHDIRSVLPAVYGNVVSLTLAVMVDVIGIFTGALSGAAWLILLLHVVFLGAFGYCVRLIRGR